jgi:hypothetical protein
MATNQVVDLYAVPGTTATGTADYGIAAAPNGHLAFMSEKVFGSIGTGNSIRYCPVYDTQSAYRPLAIVPDVPTHPCGGGVRFDLKGNLYVGRVPAGPGIGLPSVITSDQSYRQTTGVIHRYAATGGLNGDLFTAVVSAPDKIYDVDFASLANTNDGSHCDCMTAMFGVDAWGRLYVPNGPFQKISVLDNAGNRVARFGSYGNIDNVAEELAGRPGTAGKCTMAYPFSVDASDNYIYAGDPANISVLRFKKSFALDNVPAMAVRRACPAKFPLSLSSAPNPFYPQSRVTFSLPGRAAVRLEVVDLSGRLIKVLDQGERPAGAHTVAWNGADREGRSAAAGVYVYRLTAGDKTIIAKTILAR